MAFVPHAELHTGPEANALCFLIHGALGSGQNLRGLVARLRVARPELAFALIDLRGHGRSRAADPPHTLTTCAADLAQLARAFAEAEPGLPLRSVIGHSLGGKVALKFGQGSSWPLRSVWALDSNPGSVAPELALEVPEVIAAVRRVGPAPSSRPAVLEALTGQGLSRGLAQWLTTNLRQVDAQLRWSLELDVIEALFADYCAADLWEFLEQPRPGLDKHLMIAARSDRWTPEMRQRAGRLEEAATRVHHVADAGHWLHVDNPARVVELLARYL